MKEVVISKNSVFTLLYRFFWRDSLPVGLCGYVWSLLVAIIFVVPYTLFNIPFFVYVYFGKSKGRPFLDEMRGSSLGELLSISIISWALLFAVFTHLTVLASFFWDIPTSDGTVTVFWVINVILFFIGIAVIHNYAIKIKDNLNMEKYRRYLSEKYGRDTADKIPKEDLIYHYKLDHKKQTSFIEIIIESIKSFYNKNCPRINWK